MAKKVQTTKRNIFSFTLLLLAIFNIVSTTLFIHSHRINETTIAHSHPFAGRPDSHHHSSASLNFIARQVISEMLIAETTLLNFVGNYTEYVQSTAVVAADTRLQVDQTSLRAPPVA
jgi:hypothetical protein